MFLSGIHLSLAQLLDKSILSETFLNSVECLRPGRENIIRMLELCQLFRYNFDNILATASIAIY